MLGTLLGNYRIMQHLCEGSGGVYLGRHEALGHRVVVKVLPPARSSNRSNVQRCFSDAQAATAIRNAGIAQVVDLGIASDGRAYIVTELLEGESLAARLRKGPRDAAEGCRLGRQVAGALYAAHAAGVIHRDLNPDNLFLVRDPAATGGERIKVLDFGIARLAGETRGVGGKNAAGLVAGTPAYMSPEQCRSAGAADARSDIYSLGCILFELTCGRPPFVSPNVVDAIAAQLHDAPPHPLSIVPDLPPRLAALILRMLAKHPDARPQTMETVNQALGEILQAIDAAPRPAAQASPEAAPARPSPAPSASPPPPPAPTAADDAPVRPSPAPTSMASPRTRPSPTPVARAAAVSLSPDSALRIEPTRITRRRHPDTRRMLFIAGSVLCAGIAGAVVFFLSAGHSSSAGKLVSDRDVTASRVAEPPRKQPGAIAPAPPPAAPSPPAAAPATAAAPPASAVTADTADSIARDCSGHLLTRHWQSLAQCADRLKPLDPAHAAELRGRATEELRSAPHSTAVTAALHDHNLKQAKIELDQVWSGSVELAALKHTYELAEAREIDTLAAEFDRLRDPSCNAFHERLAAVRTRSPAHVLAEVTHRVHCVAAPAAAPPSQPPPGCDADALAAQGGRQFSAGQLAESLASYEAAYACQPAGTLLQKQLVVACNLHDEPRAKSAWSRLSEPLRTSPILAICIRNGLTEATLSAR